MAGTCEDIQHVLNVCVSINQSSVPLWGQSGNSPTLKSTTSFSVYI